MHVSVEGPFLRKHPLQTVIRAEQLLADAAEDANREWVDRERALRQQIAAQGDVEPEDVTRALRTARRFFIAGYLVGWATGMAKAA